LACNRWALLFSYYLQRRSQKKKIFREETFTLLSTRTFTINAPFILLYLHERLELPIAIKEMWIKYLDGSDFLVAALYIHCQHLITFPFRWMRVIVIRNVTCVKDCKYKRVENERFVLCISHATCSIDTRTYSTCIYVYIG
jgi:hypothetical protein